MFGVPSADAVATIEDESVLHRAGLGIGLAEAGEGMADDDPVGLALDHGRRVDWRQVLEFLERFLGRLGEGRQLHRVGQRRGGRLRHLE